MPVSTKRKLKLSASRTTTTRIVFAFSIGVAALFAVSGWTVLAALAGQLTYRPAAGFLIGLAGVVAAMYLAYSLVRVAAREFGWLSHVVLYSNGEGSILRIPRKWPWGSADEVEIGETVELRILDRAPWHGIQVRTYFLWTGPSVVTFLSWADGDAVVGGLHRLLDEQAIPLEIVEVT